MNVAFLPFYEENPYQRLLNAGLRELGVNMSPIRGTWFIGAILRSRPDVVHFHWLDPFFNRGSTAKGIAAFLIFLVQWPILRALGARIVWTVHNIQSHERRLGLIDRWLGNLVGGAASRIIVHCDMAARRFLELRPQIDSNKITVIPHGNYIGVYPDNAERVAARRQLGLSDDRRVLLFLGHVRRYKGVPELISRFADDPALRDADLVVVGQTREPELAQELTAIAARTENIHLTLEFAPDDQVQVYMAAADAVAAPFRDVLTSGSLILALSFGKVVIAPKTGCVADLAGDVAGYFYDAEDPQGLGDALRVFAASEEDLGELGRRNKAFAQSLSWDTIAALTKSAYGA